MPHNVAANALGLVVVAPLNQFEMMVFVSSAIVFGLITFFVQRAARQRLRRCAAASPEASILDDRDGRSDMRKRRSIRLQVSLALLDGDGPPFFAACNDDAFPGASGIKLARHAVFSFVAADRENAHDRDHRWRGAVRNAIASHLSFAWARFAAQRV